MGDLSKLEQQLNQMILTGKQMEAFEQFYAEECVMQEPGSEPCVGKDANRARELQVMANVETFHGGELLSWAVGDNVTFSEWSMEVTWKGGGRVKMEQVARRRWKDGKVVHERFYYKS